MECGHAQLQKSHCHVFSQELDFPLVGKHAAFTVRYRIDPNAQWQWVNDLFGTKDGELVFEPTAAEIEKPLGVADSANQLAEFIDGLNSRFKVESRVSESPGAVLWKVTGEVDPASGGKSVSQTEVLGRPKDFVRNFSLVRIWEPWVAPRHGMQSFKLTEDALLLSFLRRDGKHLVLLAVSVNGVRTLFQSGENNEVVVSAKNDNDYTSTFEVLVAVASSFEVGNAAVMYEARRAVGQFSQGTSQSVTQPTDPLSPEGSDVVFVEKDPEAQWLSNWYDGLAYCTWNALGQDLTEEKILAALDTLKASGINIVNLIIDDNWQSLDNKGESQFKRGWTEFEANKEGFPRGLKHTVDKIRSKHPNINHVAVWHALMGYWGGIAPDGQLAKTYKTKVVKKIDGVAGGTMTAIDPDDIYRFYEDAYSFLSSTGVDSVKTDAQFFLDLLEDPDDRARFNTAYQDAWSIASLRYFQAKAISCMSQAPQIIFHSQVPTNKPRVLLRNSDDFFPDIPSSHPWHVFCNAHTALLTQHLNVLPDWDMFQTSHPYASFHAAARCVSGGPIYITDEPGKHDLDLVHQMTAPTSRGSTVILRPSVVGRTMDVYHNYNEGQVLKVGCFNGWAKTGSGILGLFNVDSSDVSLLVSILDFPGVSVDSANEYIVRPHTTGETSRVMQPSCGDSLVSVSLEVKGWEILTAYPLRSFTLGGRRGVKSAVQGEGLTKVAVLGLLGKMTGVAGIASSDILLTENKRLRFDISLKALGTLGIYISDLASRTIGDNFLVTIYGQVVPVHTVRMEATGGENGKEANVLAIDVLTAWNEMGLDSGWSNEVVVQVFMS